MGGCVRDSRCVPSGTHASGGARRQVLAWKTWPARVWGDWRVLRVQGGRVRVRDRACVRTEPGRERERQTWQCTRGSVYWRDQNREPNPDSRKMALRARVCMPVCMFACEKNKQLSQTVCLCTHMHKELWLEGGSGLKKRYLPIVLSFSGHWRSFRFLSGKVAVVG